MTVTHAAPALVHPAQTLILDGGAFRFGSEQCGIAVAVTLTHGMASRSQRDGLLVVHRHAGKGLTHVLSCSERIGLAIHTFRVYIYQAHHHCCQRVAAAPG